MKRKVFGSLGAVIFSLFAYWQLNDLSQYGTDWWQGWLLTYGMTAVLCLITVFVSLPRWLYWFVAVLAVVHALMRATAIQFDDQILYNPDNPAGNETGGLIIVCVWLLILSFTVQKKAADAK